MAPIENEEPILHRDGRDKPDHDAEEVIPGERSEGRGTMALRA
jgi:hypothetical protein